MAARKWRESAKRSRPVTVSSSSDATVRCASAARKSRAQATARWATARAAGARPVVAARGQAAGQALDHGVDGERFERLGEVGEGFAQQAGQDGIVGHDLGHEGRLAADRGRHRGRVDIEHAVGEAARPTVAWPSWASSGCSTMTWPPRLVRSAPR